MVGQMQHRWDRRRHLVVTTLLGLALVVTACTVPEDATDEVDDGGVATVVREPDTSTTSVAGTSSTPATTTTATVDTGSGGAAATALTSLSIGAPTPEAPYVRDEYQPDGWADTDGDCQNNRHEVLAEESEIPVTYDETGCFVESGEWVDPYTGEVWTDAAEVSIDHVVPLSHAHAVGAWAWDLDTKQAFANDITHPGTLGVVGQSTNSGKGASGPAEWRPSARSAWCSFATDWVSTKVTWSLPLVDEAERSALAEMLDTCDDGSLRPDQTDPPVVQAIVTSTTTSSTTTTVVPEGEARARIAACRVRAEDVTISNDGATPLDLTGYRLHDEGFNHTYVFPNGVVLEPGESVTVTSGDDARDGDGFLFWKGQNVWNNDGDTATLIGGPEELTLRCS